MGKTSVQTVEMMKSASGKSTVARLNVYKWHKRYNKETSGIKDITRKEKPFAIRRGVMVQSHVVGKVTLNCSDACLISRNSSKT